MSDAPKPRARKSKADAVGALVATTEPKPPPVAPEGFASELKTRDDAFNGADPAKFDHDGDGKPGGSKPKGALTEHELGGLFAEAFEAYDLQFQRIRFDSRNRKWEFTPEKAREQSVLLLRVTRLADVREDTISTALLASEMGREMIEDVVRKLDEALSA